MPVRGWKSVEPFLGEDDEEKIEFEFEDDDFLSDEELEELLGTTNDTTMKNIFFNTIKKQKFNDEITSKIKFGNVNKFMKMEDGAEGYLSSYSEMEFFAYQFQKLHGFHPDVLTVRFLKPEKFLENLFKYCNVPRDSYYKAYQDERGKIKINSSLFVFDTGRDDQLYMYVDSDEAVFYYNEQDDKNPDSIFQILISLLKYYVSPKVSKNKIFVVYQAQSGFEKTAFDVKKIDVDLKANYNDEFEKVSEKVIAGLNDKKKTNLVILQGAPGTGKTTYIRYLTHKLKKNIIFISPDMVNHITDPSFIPFLIKNNDAILIIEDAEQALGANGRSGAVSNILNLTDGLLSDCLNISIVATINTNMKNIDEALLRKGRLLTNYNFEKLSVEKSKALLKKLGRGDIEVKEPMTLAEIYFHGEENNGEVYQRRKVGF